MNVVHTNTRNGSTSDSEASDRDASEVGFSSGKQRVSTPLKRVIDETQLPPDEAEKLETRRAYNRECATRARKRTKNLVTQLQDEVRNLQTDKADLRRENAVIRAQLAGLEKQNQALVLKQSLADRQQQQQQQHAMGAYGMGMGGFAQPRLNLDAALADLLASHQGSNTAGARNPLFYPSPNV